MDVSAPAPLASVFGSALTTELAVTPLSVVRSLMARGVVVLNVVVVVVVVVVISGSSLE